MSDKKLLGQVLLEMQLITEEQLEQALEQQQNTGKSLGRVLVEMGVIDEETIRRVMPIQENVETIDLSRLEVPPSVIELVPAAVAKTYQVLPVALEEDDTLVLAVNDVLNQFVQEDARMILGRRIKVVLSDPEQLDAALDRYYGKETMSIDDIIKYYSEMADTVEEEDQSAVTEARVDVTSMEELANLPPVASLFNLILLQVCKENASDVHLEPFAEDFRVRYRIDGKLYDVVHPPPDLAFGLFCRFKIMSGMDIAERRLPQDGRLEFRSIGREVDLRMSTVPTVHGECMAIRVLDRTNVDFRLDNIGLSENQQKTLRRLIESPQGIILATGPTGSGKTTTLYASLKEVNTPDIKLITTEDPVEYLLDGAIQVAIRERVGLTFAACLRSILRQDPDVIFVGEIRDVETAQISIQASLTGHLVLSTLHTNDAPSTITRMVDMNVEPYLLASTIIGIVAQRLVRTLCVKCKEGYRPPESELRDAGFDPEKVGDHVFYRAVGCEHCKEGYRGRTALFEMLVPDEEVWAMVIARRLTGEIRARAIEKGMETLRADGQRKLLAGVTSFDEVLHEIHGYV